MFVKGINYVLLDYKFNQNEIKNFMKTVEIMKIKRDIYFKIS